MRTILDIYIRIVNSLIYYYHPETSEVNPYSLNKAKAISRASLVTTLFAKSLNANVIDTVSAIQVLNGLFNDRCPVVTWLQNLDPNEFACVNIDADILPNVDVGEVYEALLSVDTNGLSLSSGKNYRNQLGSYYSPTELVQYLTTTTIENYIRINGLGALGNATIIDFSCGAGVFLREAICQSVKLLKSSVSKDEDEKDLFLKVALNVYACDVDCIALEVCKWKILELVGDLSLYKTLSPHFIHGNFLLHSEKQASVEFREKLYLEGFVYHPGLAISKEFLKKYDIILGNPPWEKVRLEEKKFYAQYLQMVESIHFKFDLKNVVMDVIRSNPKLELYIKDFIYNFECSKNDIKKNTFFKDSTVGELNTSTLFTNACFSLRSQSGVVGLIIKSSTITSPINKVFFKI